MENPIPRLLMLAVGLGTAAVVAGQVDRLPPCPSSPNCVSSDADDARHHIAALRLVDTGPQSWDMVRRAVAALPRTRIVHQSDLTLRAECASAVFGFVDDIELRLRPDPASIAVRSASRVGWSDFGVNRRRVEQLRSTLINEGVVR